MSGSAIPSGTGPPDTKSRWAKAWKVLQKEKGVEPDSDLGWLEFPCDSVEDAKLLQSSLYQRSCWRLRHIPRGGFDWKVQTKRYKSTVFFRKIVASS